MCPTSSSAPGAVKDYFFLFCHYYYSKLVENIIKLIDCNELENLAEFYIFIWGTHLAAMKTSGQSNSILVVCRFKNEKSFSNSNDESRLFFLLLIFFRSNDHFSKITFGQMNFRSNDLSVKWTFGQMTLRLNDHFLEKAFGSYELSVKWSIGQMTIFRKKRSFK
jgi:hypothetical protein